MRAFLRMSGAAGGRAVPADVRLIEWRAPARRSAAHAGHSAGNEGEPGGCAADYFAVGAAPMLSSSTSNFSADPGGMTGGEFRSYASSGGM